MADVVGRGIIELVADARKLKAGIEDAKKSIRTLGEGQKDVSAAAAQSIDRYVGKLQQQAATVGKSTRETELYKLALRGASIEQINAANAALKTVEAHEKHVAVLNNIRTAAIAAGAAIGTALVVGTIAAAAAFDQLIKSAAKFQDLAETIGDSAGNFASLAVAAQIGGKSMDEVAQFSVKLAKNLDAVDEEGDKAALALRDIGLRIEDFKKLNATERIEALAKALNQFRAGSGQTEVLEALARGGAQLLPMLNELANGVGRVNILTDEQIKLADEYADRQAKLAAELKLYASAAAVQLLPALNDLTAAFLTVIKGIGGTVDATGKLKDGTIGEWADAAVRGIASVVDRIDIVIRAFQTLHSTGVATWVAIGQAATGQFSAAVETAKKSANEVNEIWKRKAFGDVIAERQANIFRNVVSGATTFKPDIKRSQRAKGGGGGALDDSGERRAQLQLDLAEIRKASEEQIGILAQSERVLGALRSAGLASEKEYYESKASFIRLIADEQERALELEIARLQQETFIGKNAAKEKLENDRKILEAQSKIRRVQLDAAAATKINAIEQEAANRKVAQSFKEASDAAGDYIRNIERRNAVELIGIGRGEQFRRELADITQITEKLEQEQRRLTTQLERGEFLGREDMFRQYMALAQETYEREVQLYHERSDAIKAAQADWLNGAREALQNYADEAKNVAKGTEQVFTKAFQGIEDVLIEISTSGKINLDSIKKLVLSTFADIQRVVLREQVTGPLADWLKGQLPGAGPAGGGSIGGGIAGAIGGAGGPGAALTTAATSFATAVGTAGATLSTEIAGAGAAFVPEITAAGVAFTAEVSAAGAAFAAEVAAGGVAGAAGGLDILGELQSGTPYVPETGLYMLHKGESVTPPGSSWSGGMTVVNNFALSGAADSRTQAQISVAAGRGVRNAMDRFA
jgi:lambda family phage tail tape measure protein